MVGRRRTVPTSPADNVSAESTDRDAPSKEQDDEQFWRDIPGADVRVFTSDGKGIPAHSGVLASSSPVLETLVHRSQMKGKNGGVDKKGRPAASVVVPLLGVPHNAVVSFLRCLYINAGFSRCPASTEESGAPAAAETTAEEASKHGVHLLVLSHALQIPWLKRTSATALAGSLTADNVVDMLQLARQCDAPGLEVRCMAMIRRDFKEVQRTEGWWFLQRNDPWLELEVLERVEEDEKSDTRRRKAKSEIRVYAELGEALQCLEHICFQGCHHVNVVGLKDRREQCSRKDETPSSSSPCAWGDMCRGLQQLLLHFAACDKRKKSGGCGRCKRMWQILRLHSAVCDTEEACCRVPFCRQFKEKAAAVIQTTGGKDNATGGDRWQLLAKKVGSAKVILNVSKRKTEDQRPPREHDQSGTTAVAVRCT